MFCSKSIVANRPEKKNIPLYEPIFFGNELAYLQTCIDTAWISSAGPLVNQFEEKIAHYLGVKHAVAVSSGTAALHLALLVNEIGPNDEVIVPAMTFMATANAVHYTGARPVFIDVDSRYWHLQPEQVLDFLKTQCRYTNAAWVNKQTGRTVKAMIPVHIMGNPCDMSGLQDIADAYGLCLIEDAAQSLGACYHGQHTGTFGTVGCLSFNGNKILTCGAGGMLVTHSEKIARRAKYLSTQARADPVHYIHNEVGYNYRFSNLHAAIGLAQLQQFNTILLKKKRISAEYRQMLGDIQAIALPEIRPNCLANEWLFTILLSDTVVKTVFDIRDDLGNRGIQTRLLWQPLHRSPAFKDCYHHNISLSNAIYRRALSLPSSASLSFQDIALIANALKKSLT